LFFLSFYKWLTGHEVEKEEKIQEKNGQTDPKSGKKDHHGFKIRKEILEDFGKSGQKKRQVSRPRKKSHEE